MLGTAHVLAQDVDVQNVTVGTPTLDCINTDIDVSGMLSAANYIYNGATVSVVGTTITVEVEYLSGIIILPAFTPFTQSVDLGVLPAGNYTVTVTGVLSGAVQATSAQAMFTVAQCCPSLVEVSATDTVVCLGESLAFTDSTLIINTTVDWYVNGVATVVTDTLTVTPTVTGPVTVTAIALNGTCYDTVTVVATVNPLPVPDLGPDPELCVGDSLVLDPGSFANYQWSNGSGDPTVTIDTVITISVDVINNFGCMASDTLVVASILPVTQAEVFSSGEFLCPGQSEVLTTNWPNAGHSWSTGETTSEITIMAGSYTVTISVPGECPGVDSVLVEENSIVPLDLGPDTTVCPGFVLTPTATYADYQWSSGSTASSVVITSSGNVGLDIMDLNGCSQDATVSITVVPTLPLSLGADTVHCATIEYCSNAGAGFASYLWSTGDTDSIFCSNQSWVLDSTYTFWVQATDGAGCTVSDSVDITIVVCLGLDELEANSVTVFPNPAQNRLQGQFAAPVKHATTLQVLDITGRVMQVEQVPAGTRQISVEVSDLPTGTYLLVAPNLTDFNPVRFVKR